MKPVYVRGKWRVGFLSLREIQVGEELCYDYGMRTDEEWTRKGRLEDSRVTSGKGRVRVGGERDADVVGQLEGRCAEVKADEREGETEGSCVEVKVEAKLESAEVRESKEPEIGKKKDKKQPKRRSWWCPIVGCASGPVQKVEQHFESCHGLPVKCQANYRLRKYKLAPTREAIQFRLSNPHARHTIQSGRSIERHEEAGPSRRPQQVRLDTLVRAEAEGGSRGEKGSGGLKGDGRKGKGRAGSAGSGGRKGKGRAGSAESGGRKGKGRAGSAESDGRKGKGRAGSAESGGRKGKGRAESARAFTRDETPRESEEDMGEGGVGLGSAHDPSDGEAFLQRFKLFLLSPLGGSRNGRTTSQIEANVRKYLTELDMDPRRLVDLTPIQPFFAHVEEGGVGCSGILQRLDAHSLALKYLNFTDDEESLP